MALHRGRERKCHTLVGDRTVTFYFPGTGARRKLFPRSRGIKTWDETRLYRSIATNDL